MRILGLPRRTDARQGARTPAGPRELPRAPSAHARRDLPHQERHSRTVPHRGDHLAVNYVKHLAAGKLGPPSNEKLAGGRKPISSLALRLRGHASAAALLVARLRSPFGSSPLAYARFDGPSLRRDVTNHEREAGERAGERGLD